MESHDATERAPRGLAVLATLLLLVPAVSAAEAIKTRPGYARGEARRPEVTRPEKRASLPDALQRKPAAVAADPQKARPGSPGPRPGMDRRDDPLTAAAREAGAWAAERLLMTRGRAEYYRTGFFLGQRDALNDPRLGRWDFEEGRRFALRDPDARRAGLSAGEVAADEAAWAEAERRVRDQFMDLSRDPRFDPGIPVPAVDLGIDRAPAPTLHEVFEAFPLSAFRAHGPRPDYLDGFAIDAVHLRGCASYSDVYNAAWDRPDTAFRLFLDDRRSRLFRTLRDPEDRKRFRAVFDVAFERVLDGPGSRPLMRAFDRGFDDGFDYGAFVHEELDYRRGYVEGFNAALERAANEGFRRAFPRSFESAYATLFREWNENPKPAIGDVRLIDGDDDGVFEPGERLVLQAELINYGGRSGSFPLSLEGTVLVSGGAHEQSVRVPARGVAWDRGLIARIDDRTRNRTRTTLSLRLDDAEVGVPLTVSRPLAIVPGSLFGARRNLDGEVRLELRVANESRRDRTGIVRVTTSVASGTAARTVLPDLAPGEARTVVLPVSGLPVLDMIAGDVALDVRVVSEDVEQDAVTHRLPEVVSDLRNNDLLDYVIALGRDPSAAPSEVSRARGLLLERLRADWFDAVRGSGNPYKQDYRRGETQTALGELVQVASDRRRGGGEVFGGLSGEVIALADDLPGMHPFLRKYMRRLARKLP